MISSGAYINLSMYYIYYIMFSEVLLHMSSNCYSAATNLIWWHQILIIRFEIAEFNSYTLLQNKSSPTYLFHAY